MARTADLRRKSEECEQLAQRAEHAGVRARYRIVAEQWFSSDLGVLVMTKHSDPRIGDTIYRLQSIVRAEPDRSFFTLPPDYTLKESGIRPQN